MTATMKRIGDAWRGWLHGMVGRTVEPTKQQPKTPSAGEKWRIDDGDPFPPKNTVTILDVSDGWVRYQIGKGTMFDDERMSVKRFIGVYRYHASAPNAGDERPGANT